MMPEGGRFPFSDFRPNTPAMTLLWWLLAALTAAACAYLLLAMAAVAALRLPSGPGWAVPPRVTVLKPLCGDEDELEAALDSFLSQAMTAPVTYVFGVADPADPALALARRVADRHPQAFCRFVVDARVHGPNPKVSNLVNMAESLSEGLAEVVVISDSDIVIAPGALARAVDRLAGDGIGAVTALYRARPGRAGDRARVMGAWFIDYWFLPMAVLHARLAPLSVTYGPLTAVRREVLAAAGGLRVLADHLSDDAELGRRVTAAGWQVAFGPDLAETLVNDADMAELFDHELRWARTVRGLDPLGYGASLVSHPGPLPLLLPLLSPNWPSLLLAVLPVLLHCALARLTAYRLGRNPQVPLPGPLAVWWRDVFCFAVWARGLFVRRVGWRGARLAVSHRDVLAP